MKLDFFRRRPSPVPFAPGTRIPWDDADFSRRMLREHLDQRHDRGSRRFEVIDQQVAWIHHAMLGDRPGRILDLGCGPGLYTHRLAQLGHRCEGIDFSPASIAHARSQGTGLSCSYRLLDLRQAELGTGFDIVLMLFGEFNSFAPDEAHSLLVRACGALANGGRLVLELPWHDYVRELGEESPSWSFQEAGLFADVPHLTLRENAWHDEIAAATQNYFVFCEDEPPVLYTQSTRAYRDEDLEIMLKRAGLASVSRYESLGGIETEFFGLVAERSVPAR